MTVHPDPYAHFKAGLQPNLKPLSVAEKISVISDDLGDLDPNEPRDVAVVPPRNHLSSAEADAVMGVLWHKGFGEYLLPDIGEAIRVRNRADLLKALGEAIWRLNWVYAAMTHTHD
jgi:hypothetical protein